MPKRRREVHLEPGDASSAPHERVLKPRSAIHLAERFSERAPITFAILGLHADLLEKRIQATK